MADADGLDEAAEQILRVALTAGAQLAERVAQARTQAQREAAARSGRDARDLAVRVQAERRTADAQLARTRDPRWITVAEPREIADAYATARQWAGADPAAARDAQRILDQVRERYGADAVPDGLDRAGDRTIDRTADLSADGGVGSPARRAARAEAAVVLTTPDAHAQVKTWLAEHPGPLPGLTHAETVEAVDARLRAGLSQAQPATEATGSITAAAAPAISATRTVAVASSNDLERD